MISITAYVKKCGEKMNGFDFMIGTKNDMIAAIEVFGFLPFFANEITGFSIEEHAAGNVWYTPGSGDWKVWEWKGPVIRESACAYGKFFGGKAVFISRKWFPEFANYRRNGYDFDAAYDDGLIRYSDKELYELIAANAPVLSKSLKAAGDYGKNGKKGFDGIVTRLQSQCYVTISDFVYSVDKNGEPYGWGIAEYTTPEKQFGKEFSDSVYKRTPEESYKMIFEHIRRLFPDAGEKAIKKLLK